MKKIILFLFLFGIINFLAVLGHIELFQSNIPYISWTSMAIHVVGLVLFPYKRFFIIKQQTNESK